MNRSKLFILISTLTFCLLAFEFGVGFSLFLSDQLVGVIAVSLGSASIVTIGIFVWCLGLLNG